MNVDTFSGVYFNNYIRLLIACVDFTIVIILQSNPSPKVVTSLIGFYPSRDMHLPIRTFENNPCGSIYSIK